MESDILRRGYVRLSFNKGPTSSLSRSISTKKYWIILFAKSAVSRSRLEIFKGEDDVTKKNPLRVIDIESVERVVPNSDKKELSLALPNNETVMLCCVSRAEHDDWLNDIQLIKTNRKLNSPPVAAPPDEDHFRVTLRQAPSLLFHGPCTLEIQRDFERNLFHIALFCDDVPPRLVVKWQIDHIRQYGSNDVAFKFQSGSKSPTNVDWFTLETKPGDAPKIHRAVDYWAHHIVEQARNLPRRNTMSAVVPSPHSPIQMSSSLPACNSMISGPTPDQTYMPLVQSTRNTVPIYDGIVRSIIVVIVIIIIIIITIS
jgi:hypothetical protein